MARDCYGYDSDDFFFMSRKKEAYEVVKSGNYTYIRFSKADVGPIHRIDESVSGTTKITWTWGSWANKASLTYTTDLNTPIFVEE